ncbi:hypothetical protein [Bdellovibrio svalbardensis]|uniref:Secreted protein n=1 Tax=Bdellovibrio svalbardensis TaxID=2972972 RepID=A0ABT6DLS0_9BACT|nr:hypothetical protein [Bdellovibrio svalbardensis]MDG0817825.1 hypothetical protein [Bdellovibrio svalbardensis]
MKKIILSALTLWTINSLAAPAIPELPTDACERGVCTEKMRSVLNNFNSTPFAVKLTPGVYSGECNHSDRTLDPNVTHYAEILIDNLENGTPYFSSIFAFFFPENPYASWDLARARQSTTDNWKRYGKIVEGSQASRIEVYEDEGAPVNAYYMRQDPQTGTIYYIIYFGFGSQNSTSFCTMTPNSL